MSSYLRPRRGKKSTAIAQLTSSNPLKRGEIFFEVPDEGVGTGAGKIKMGDGVTAYADLPYFSDVEEVGTELTQAQYNALTPEQKANGTYWITDASGGNVVIDTALDATSNNAIANKPVAEAITQLNNDLAINKIDDISNLLASTMSISSNYRQSIAKFHNIMITDLVLTGTVSPGGTILTLPEGYRPLSQIGVVGLDASIAKGVNITPNGDVYSDSGITNGLRLNAVVMLS